MNFRRSALRAMFIRHEKVRFSGRPTAIAAAAAFAIALLGGAGGNALAAPARATSAPDTASAGSSTTAVVAVAAGAQYTVHAGQSLNDVAIAITQSHDRAVLARATRALFDTNPAAFMNHDPSRMRVGAVLIVPALDASGALAASSTGAAGGASESTAAAPASASTAAPAEAAASMASAARAAVQATTPAASEVSGAASAAVSTGAAAGGLASSAPVAGSAPAAASGTQEWTGSIQPAASAPAGQAPSAATAAAPAAAPAAAAAQAASQPRQKVSSLQQLLALKNRVLMELQKHGIGGAPVASSPKPTSAAQPAAAGSAATVPVAPQHANAATSPSNEGGLSQRNLSIAAAVGAALVVLLAALRMGRRKREKEAAARAAEATDAAVAGSARDGDSRDGSAVAGQTAVAEASDAQDQELARQAAAAAAAEHAAAEREAAERAAEESAAAEGAAAEQAAAERAAAEQVERERAAAERAAAEEHAEAERVAAERAAAEQAAAEQAAAEQAAARVAAEHAEAERTAAERIASERAAEEQAAQQAGTLSSGSEPSTEPPSDAPAPDETLRSAGTAANLAAAAELGADALPLGPLEPTIGATQDENAHHVQWDEESTESPTAPHTATAEPQSPLNVPPPVIDFTQHQTEPRATTSLGQPFSDIPVPVQPAASAPTDFPRDAVDAFGSLNMPLPPRIEVPTVGEAAPSTSLSTQPVASPDTTAQQAFGVHGADDDTPHVADQIAAGTAGHGAVAGLGAAGFGALKLDFDLELPPSPAQPLPAFTPADLARIARNKLELASEYIELGDLGGARALINEVIEANDPATRTEARALLSTLAPLS
ncbi:FimV/HubP family polar landmark protein [Paraburkholderia sp. EG304]|uniref:FimV/HubP family polar landmark protein n=1 Tax=Paraburkholderia sp. EG304 TaxID=3237015 RepID=UPI00397880AA